MKKRYEQFPPDQDFIRPDAPPDAGKKSADDFARHLADLLRAEKEAREASAPARPEPIEAFAAHRDPEPAPAVPEPEPALSPEPTPLPADLEAELADLLEMDPKPAVQPESEPAPAASDAEPSAPRRTTPQPARHSAKPVLSRGADLQPARLEVRPSAQEARGPYRETPFRQDAAERSADTPLVRTDLSSKPFIPPEEDPSLDEIFNASPEDQWLREVLASFPEEEAIPGDTPEPKEAVVFPADLQPDLPPEPAPLSRDTTGSLPSLEELFGPSAAPEPEREEAPAPPTTEASASVRPARGGKLHGLFGSLLLSPNPEEQEESEASSAAASPEPEPLPAEDAAELSEQALPTETEPVPEAEPIPESIPTFTVEDAAASEASAVPAQPSETAATAEAQTLLHRKKPSGAGRGATALTLEELLAAAVPIEEAAPPQISPPQPEEAPKPAVRRHRKHNRKQPALRPDKGSSAVKAAAAAVSAQAASVPLAEMTVAREAAASAAELPVQKAHAAPKKAEPERAARPNRPPEKPADPVPSADVRKEVPQAKKPERSSPPVQEPAAKPTEERSVLHPEEAYRLYATPLDEIGTRLILTGLFTILSLFFTLYLARHWTFLPEIFSGGTTVYVQFGLLGLMFLTCRKLLFRKLRQAHGLHPGLLLILAAFFTAIDCISAAKTLRSPFTVVFGVLAMIFLWGEYDRGLGFSTTLKVLRGESLSSGVSEVPESSNGSRGLVRTPPNVDRFMEKLETRDLTERILRVFTPTSALCGLVLMLLIALGLKQDLAWTGSLIFLGSIPTAGLLAFPRLYLLLSRRLAETDAALCGYYGAEVFGGEHSILIGDEDIFPAGSLTLNGFKVYSSNPDRIIAYAAAAARSSGSALDPVFDDLLVTHNGRHYTVDTFRFYDSGGIGASIGEDVVLMGSLDFMRRMGVHMDKGARVKQAVYLSLNGELAAVFAVRYTPPENLHKGLASIAANRHFKGILVTRTFLGTPAFLKAKFGIPAGTFLYPSTSERIRLSEAELKRTGAQGAILAKDSFSGFAQAAAGGRMLRSACLGAAILTVLGGISGLLLMSVLAALKAQETATALNLLLYVGAWLAPTLLLSVWGRHF